MSRYGTFWFMSACRIEATFPDNVSEGAECATAADSEVGRPESSGRGVARTLDFGTGARGRPATLTATEARTIRVATPRAMSAAVEGREDMDQYGTTRWARIYLVREGGGCSLRKRTSLSVGVA